MGKIFAGWARRAPAREQTAQVPAPPPVEEIYARAGDDLSSVPWARLAPHPLLMLWLDSPDWPGDCPARHADGGEALVIGCGLGDEAEELARRVTR